MSVERLGGAARANEDDENVDEDQINNENIEDDDEDDDDDDDAANRGRWSVAEDTQLRAAIATHGNSKTNWHAVSLLVPGR
jgi:hypothetical protein